MQMRCLSAPEAGLSSARCAVFGSLGFGGRPCGGVPRAMFRIPWNTSKAGRNSTQRRPPLAAQALCLEEMTGKPVRLGAIYHHLASAPRVESGCTATTGCRHNHRCSCPAPVQRSPPPVNDKRCDMFTEKSASPKPGGCNNGPIAGFAVRTGLVFLTHHAPAERRRAVVDTAKLRDYCLNMHHPRGRHKARVFLTALGLAAADAEYVRESLLRAASAERAVLTETDEYGAFTSSISR